MIEIVRQDDVAGGEGDEGAAEFRQQVHQHGTSAKLLGSLLDLGEAVHGGGIDAGDELKIKQQEAAVGGGPNNALTC
jgi:hypothetical protein